MQLLTSHKDRAAAATLSVFDAGSFHVESVSDRSSCPSGVTFEIVVCFAKLLFEFSCYISEM